MEWVGCKIPMSITVILTGAHYCARSTDGANAVYWWMYSGHLVKMGVDDKDEAG